METPRAVRRGSAVNALPTTKENLALAYVAAKGIDADKARYDWDGCCLDFADELQHWLDAKKKRYRLLYFERANERAYEHFGDGPLIPSSLDARWRFHAAVECEGLVHDLWIEDALPLPEYLKAMFPGQRVSCEAFDEEGGQAPLQLAGAAV
jgi:hypothetical protein